MSAKVERKEFRLFFDGQHACARAILHFNLKERGVYLTFHDLKYLPPNTNYISFRNEVMSLLKGARLFQLSGVSESRTLGIIDDIISTGFWENAMLDAAASALRVVAKRHIAYVDSLIS